RTLACAADVSDRPPGAGGRALPVGRDRGLPIARAAHARGARYRPRHRRQEPARHPSHQARLEHDRGAADARRLPPRAERHGRALAHGGRARGAARLRGEAQAGVQGEVSNAEAAAPEDFDVPALRSLVQLSAIIAIVSIAAPASAQDWPAGTTRMVVPYAAGGPVDFPARLLIDRLAAQTQGVFILENPPRAGRSVGPPTLVQAPPDGATFLLTTSSVTMVPTIYPK